MSRRVTLVLTTLESAAPLVAPPFEVHTPWWPDVEPVVAEAARLGVEATVLRLLDASPDPRHPSGMAGTVTYLAETPAEAYERLIRAGAAEHCRGVLDDHPLRASWARPGGPARHVAWADAALRANRRPRSGPVVQVKSWNLTGLWMLPTAVGPVWLKTVPAFFAHEGRVIAALGDAPVPPLLAAEDGRLLLDHVDGEDQWDAPLPVQLEMVALLVELQFRCIDRADELLRLGAADLRAPALGTAGADLLERNREGLDGADRSILETLVEGLDRRFARVDACGLPDTLVHGDFHPGNVRGGSGGLVVLDWGDCGVGHPLLDLDAMIERVLEPARLRAAWFRHWRRRLPGCDPARAAELLAPVGCLRRAIVYQVFLDGIEPSERRYHAADVIDMLARAAAIARSER